MSNVRTCHNVICLIISTFVWVRPALNLPLSDLHVGAGQPRCFSTWGKFKKSCLVKGPSSSPLIFNRLVHYFGHHQPIAHCPSHRPFTLRLACLRTSLSKISAINSHHQLLKWEELNWMQVENFDRKGLINNEPKVEFLVVLVVHFFSYIWTLPSRWKSAEKCSFLLFTNWMITKLRATFVDCLRQLLRPFVTQRLGRRIVFWDKVCAVVLYERST